MKKINLLAVIAMLFLFSACGVKKYVPEDERLFSYAEVEVEYESRERDKKSIGSELQGLVRPQPNTTLLGGRPYLRWHYRATGEKSNFINRWLNKRFGEEPVYLSEVNIERNEQIIQNRLENKGFFNTHVTHRKDTTKKHRTGIIFEAVTEAPYHLRNYTTEGIPDRLDQLIKESMDESLLERGMRYDLTSMRAERNRIRDHLLENGYFYFSADYLLFSMDTAIGERQFDLFLQLKPDIPQESIFPYKIKEIFLYPDQGLPTATAGSPDTVEMENYTVISTTDQFKPRRFGDYILFEKGGLYKKTQSDRTRQRLFSIGAFGFVNIRHREVESSVEEGDDHRMLESRIYLSPLSKIGLRAELQAVTKSNNFMGPVMTGEYRDRNAFGGGEKFNLGIKLGYETQITGGRQTGLSALEAGVYGELIIPRIVAPIKWRDNIAYGVPRTRVNLSYSFLSRVKNYQLQSANFGFAYQWNGSRYVYHEIKPIALTYTRLAKTSDEFEEILKGNPFLQRSFEQQFIPGMEYSFTFNNKSLRDRSQNYFIQIRADISGNLFNLAEEVLKEEPEQIVFGREYARYLRLDMDFRYYLSLGEESQLVARIFGGMGKPLGNSLSLPYIKQYFSGGPNSVRAFRIRSLGPGSYQPEETGTRSFFDQAGDIRIEANLEYRFPMFPYFNGAFFIDAGNIWLFNENEVLPGGKFSDQWVNELGVGAGFGIRLDIDLFVIRLDLATPLRKPWLEEGERWISSFRFGKKEWRRENLSWNIAIGYPF